MTPETEIQKKLEERDGLVSKIKKKRDKVFKIAMLLTRNRHELCKMIKKHDSLDREIFEKTKGITNVGSYKEAESKKTNAKILSDAFIDSLSDEMRTKLFNRLQNRMEMEKIRLLECSLKEGESS